MLCVCHSSRVFSKGFQEKSKAGHQTYANDLAEALKESRQQHADKKYIQVFAVSKTSRCFQGCHSAKCQAYASNAPQPTLPPAGADRGSGIERLQAGDLTSKKSKSTTGRNKSHETMLRGGSLCICRLRNDSVPRSIIHLQPSV